MATESATSVAPMKGIVLAGGAATRLHPATIVVSKHLLPVYDKPMIYYPLSLLMLAGIRDILLISTANHVPLFRELLGDGAELGVRLAYAVQAEPRGIAEALLIGEAFIAGCRCMLVLGDNLLHGPGVRATLVQAAESVGSGAVLFAQSVAHPAHYGVVSFDADGRVTDLVEKPCPAPTPYAVPGLYFYGPGVSAIARTLVAGPRGELEITDVNRVYVGRGQCRVRPLGPDFAWFDMGSPGQLLAATSFVAGVQSRDEAMVACLEEIAFENGWIDREVVARRARVMSNSEYGRHLDRVASRADRRKRA